jgi:hypothetical protein
MATKNGTTLPSTGKATASAETKGKGKALAEDVPNDTVMDDDDDDDDEEDEEEGDEVNRPTYRAVSLASSEGCANTR